ncbi:MAG: hypothetical protein WCF07_08050 [Nitrososphaeraceae archaeon]
MKHLLSSKMITGSSSGVLIIVLAIAVLLSLQLNSPAEGQGSLYRILPTSEGATSTGVPPPTTPDTVTPPVTDEGEAEAEEDAEDEANGNSDNNNDGED